MAETNWYVVHTYSGYENKVKANIDKAIENRHLEEEILEVRVPMQEVAEVKNGVKKVVQKKLFPGYVLINMVMNDDTWYVVRNTPGVTGFVGSGTKPVPLSDYEVSQLFKDMGIETPKPKINLKLKQVVRITDAAFKNLTGTVIEIDEDRSRVKVLVAMLGRDTPVDLDVSQVESID